MSTRSSSDSRPYPPLSAAEQAALMRDTTNLGDRLLLRVLLDHDGGDSLGSFPGYKLLADLTGWALGTVLNRLSRLRKSGRIQSVRGAVGSNVRYFVAPPVPTSREAVISDITQGREVPTSHKVVIPDITQDSEVPTSRETVRCDITSTSRHAVDSIKLLPSPPPNPKTSTSKKRTRGNGGPPQRETWLSSFAGVWELQYGGHPSFGRLAKALDPLVKQHGPDAVLESWRRYLADTGAKYAAPEKFAQTFGSWAPAADPAIARALRESARASGGPA